MPLEFIVVFAPLLGALVAGLFQRFIGDKIAMAITTGLLFLAAACALVVFKEAAFDHVKRTTDIARWISIGGFEGNWALKVDTLSATMLVVVTSVSSLVHLYSIG